MVILENGGSSATSSAPIVFNSDARPTVATMLAATGSRYLNPDYLTPLPSDVSVILTFVYSF